MPKPIFLYAHAQEQQAYLKREGAAVHRRLAAAQAAAVAEAGRAARAEAAAAAGRAELAIERRCVPQRIPRTCERQSLGVVFLYTQSKCYTSNTACSAEHSCYAGHSSVLYSSCWTSETGSLSRVQAYPFHTAGQACVCISMYICIQPSFLRASMSNTPLAHLCTTLMLTLT